MAEILFLTLSFPPDGNSTALLMAQLARDLTEHGHRVTVVTTRPHNVRDPLAEGRQPIRRRWGPLLGESDYHGIRVLHTFVPRKGSRVWLRLLGWAGFNALSTFAALTVVPRPDLIFVPSPPLTSGLVGWIVGGIRRAPYVYNVQEVYPDIAVRLGALRNRLFIRVLSGIEKWVYRKAAKVTVIAPGMRRDLEGKGVPPNKLELIPNFVDTSEMAIHSKDNAFSRAHGVENKFVVCYAGNIGPAQGLETVLEAAALLRDEPRVHFLIMGEGSGLERFGAAVAEMELGNLSLLPYQPREQMPLVYAASDLNLVPMAVQTGLDALPSKVYRIMACSRPILVLADDESDLAVLLREARCGLVVHPGSPEALTDEIRKAIARPESLAEMGAAGKAYVEKHNRREMITGAYEALFSSLTHTRAAEIPAK